MFAQSFRLCVEKLVSVLAVQVTGKVVELLYAPAKATLEGAVGLVLSISKGRVEEFADVWESLANLGWVMVTPSHIRLVGDGVFYTPLIQSLLARDRVLELRRIGFASRREM